MRSDTGAFSMEQTMYHLCSETWIRFTWLLGKPEGSFSLTCYRPIRVGIRTDQNHAHDAAKTDHKSMDEWCTDA